MKKIAGKIAMILVLVMLANSFSGCFTVKAWSGEYDDGALGGFFMRIGAPLVDIFLIGVVVVAVLMLLEAPNETDIYLASAENNLLMDYSSAMEILNTLPETERAALMEKLNALPAEKLASLISTLASLPQAEIAASIERVNALSETELVSTVQDFKALSEAEIDVLVEQINSKAKTDNVVLADELIIFQKNRRLAPSLTFIQQILVPA